MRLRAPAVVSQNLRLHGHTAESGPQEDRPSLVPVQGVPSAQSCSRLVGVLLRRGGLTIGKRQNLWDCPSNDGEAHTAFGKVASTKADYSIIPGRRLPRVSCRQIRWRAEEHCKSPTSLHSPARLPRLLCEQSPGTRAG